MSLESVLFGKALAARRAVIRFLSCVNALVRLERTLLSEAAPALQALVRFLSGVNALMSLEITLMIKALAALGAVMSSLLYWALLCEAVRRAGGETTCTGASYGSVLVSTTCFNISFGKK